MNNEETEEVKPLRPSPVKLLVRSVPEHPVLMLDPVSVSSEEDEQARTTLGSIRSRINNLRRVSLPASKPNTATGDRRITVGPIATVTTSIAVSSRRKTPQALDLSTIPVTIASPAAYVRDTVAMADITPYDAAQYQELAALALEEDCAEVTPTDSASGQDEVGVDDNELDVRKVWEAEHDRSPAQNLAASGPSTKDSDTSANDEQADSTVAKSATSAPVARRGRKAASAMDASEIAVASAPVKRGRAKAEGLSTSTASVAVPPRSRGTRAAKSAIPAAETPPTQDAIPAPAAKVTKGRATRGSRATTETETTVITLEINEVHQTAPAKKTGRRKAAAKEEVEPEPSSSVTDGVEEISEEASAPPQRSRTKAATSAAKVSKAQVAKAAAAPQPEEESSTPVADASLQPPKKAGRSKPPAAPKPPAKKISKPASITADEIDVTIAAPAKARGTRQTATKPKEEAVEAAIPAKRATRSRK